MKKLFISLWFIILISFTLISFSACGSDSGNDNPSDPIKEYSGKLEKGAFQKGAEIIAYEWDATTGYSGESFVTTTTDNLGNYQLKSSKIRDLLYVKAEGYFYNENSGTTSDSTLKLYSIIDSTKVPWNINVLTHIIKDRVTALLESGKTYDQSINQAMTELYSNFGWTAVNPGTISITNNAQLLMLSAAICKDRSVSQISDLLTALSADFEDGTIDVSALDVSIYDVDVTTVQNNMIELYGTTPSLQPVKDALIAFREISAPVYLVEPIPTDCEFYYFTESKQLIYVVTDSYILPTFQPSVLITQEGHADVATNFTFDQFFKIGTTIYFSGIFDGEMRYMSQYNGVVSILTAETFPEKPVKPRVEMNNGRFSITTNYWDIYTVSDIRNVTLASGIARTLLCTNYHLTTWNGQYGMFFVAVDSGLSLITSGLYFYPENQMSQNRVYDGAGEMW